MVLSRLAQRAALMRSGYTYAEAQATIMSEAGYEVEGTHVLDQRRLYEPVGEEDRNLGIPGILDRPWIGEPVVPSLPAPPPAGGETRPPAPGGLKTTEILTPGGTTMPSGSEAGAEDGVILKELERAEYLPTIPEMQLGAFPLAIPLVAGLASMTVGALRALLVRFGPTILKSLIGLAAFKELMDMIGIGAPDDTQIKIRLGKKRKRYSIGSNPRVGTLAKVSRHCSRMLKRHEKVIREFLPKKQVRYGIPPSRMLSSAEKKLLREG